MEFKAASLPVNGKTLFSTAAGLDEGLYKVFIEDGSQSVYTARDAFDLSLLLY